MSSPVSAYARRNVQHALRLGAPSLALNLLARWEATFPDDVRFASADRYHAENGARRLLNPSLAVEV